MKLLISERLKELMELKHISQYQLAKDLNCSQSIVSEWLSGKHKPSIDSVWILADYFDTSIDILVGRKEY